MMKTLTITADETIVDRLVSLFELFPKGQYTMKVTDGESRDDVRKPLSIARGSGKHLITYISEDFDEPLDDFDVSLI